MKRKMSVVAFLIITMMFMSGCQAIPYLLIGGIEAIESAFRPRESSSEQEEQTTPQTQQELLQKWAEAQDRRAGGIPKLPARELPIGTPVSGNTGELAELFILQATENGPLIITRPDRISMTPYRFESDNIGEINSRFISFDGNTQTETRQIDLLAGRTYLFKVYGISDSRGESYTITAMTAAQFAAVEQQRQEEARRQQQLAQQQQLAEQQRQQQLAQQQEAARRQQQQQEEARRQQSGEAFTIRQNADNTLTITGYRSLFERTTMTIPSTIQSLRVTVIGREALSYGLNGVVLPNTLVTIEPYAFYNSLALFINANNLGEVIIPNSVTDIGEYAFSTAGISRLTLPASIRTIGRNAFSGNSTTRITVPANLNDSILTGNNAAGLPQGFVNFYISQRKAAGTYVLNGQIWTRQ
jgi:multidrug efflux pump subunit AcrA (membrane-fusion protein)